jgi:hypothetical protein
MNSQKKFGEEGRVDVEVDIALSSRTSESGKRTTDAVPISQPTLETRGPPARPRKGAPDEAGQDRTNVSWLGATGPVCLGDHQTAPGDWLPFAYSPNNAHHRRKALGWFPVKQLRRAHRRGAIWRTWRDSPHERRGNNSHSICLVAVAHGMTWQGLAVVGQ